MRKPLLVAVAHGLDLVSFLMALSIFGIQGEGNTLMQTAYTQLGLFGIISLKTSGTIALACITILRPWALLPAAGAGIVGSTVNVMAIAI